MARRDRQRTPDGRAKPRDRAAVAHRLAHVGRGPGRRARYRGPRKNLCDLRRCAAIPNLHALARGPAPEPRPAATATAA